MPGKKKWVEKGEVHKMGIILGIVFGVIATLCIIDFIYYWRDKHNKR